MARSIMDVSPFVPSDKSLESSVLPDLVMDLSQKSSKLSGKLTSQTQTTLEGYMCVVNSYYSNLIEGNATLPHEIRAAQRGDYHADLLRRDLQQESLGHMAVQLWLQEQSPDVGRLFSPAFIKQIHQQFYLHIPESLWDIKNEQGSVVSRVVPGEWREQGVVVGRHVPPAGEDLAVLMERYCEIYNPQQFNGDRKLIAIMAAHHRFAWVHPFLDGNGRVGRLISDTALKASGLDSCGTWCLSRGLAKGDGQYKALLAQADHVRAGAQDGRGHLTEKGLLAFCEYMLTTAIDQVDYVSVLLDLTNLRRRIDAYIQARNDFRVLGMDKELKPVAGLILHTAFIYGELERSQAIELCGMPERTARRLLSQLKADGLLSETSSKSPLRWEIPEHAEPWYFPELAPRL